MSEWREEGREGWANQVCQCVVNDFAKSKIYKFSATSCKLFCERQRCCSSGVWCIPSTLGRWFSEQEKNWRSGVSSKPWAGRGGREMREGRERREGGRERREGGRGGREGEEGGRERREGDEGREGEEGGSKHY